MTPPPELSPEEPAASQSDAGKSTRLQRRALAALADELSTRTPAPRANPSVVARPLPTEPRLEFQPKSQLEVPLEPRIESRPEPQIAPPQPVAAEPTSTADKAWPKWRIVSEQRCASRSNLPVTGTGSGGSGGTAFAVARAPPHP